MTEQQLSFEVYPGARDSSTSKIMTARIALTPERPAPTILQYFRSHLFKADFMEGYVTPHEPGCGVELRGGPRPVFKVENDRNSEVLAYEQDVRVTKGI